MSLNPGAERRAVRVAEGGADRPCWAIAVHGVPVSLKDQFDYEGVDSTIGFTHQVGKPAATHSTLVSILLAAGAVPFVKTNVPQTMLAFECSYVQAPVSFTCQPCAERTPSSFQEPYLWPLAEPVLVPSYLRRLLRRGGRPPRLGRLPPRLRLRHWRLAPDPCALLGRVRDQALLRPGPRPRRARQQPRLRGRQRRARPNGAQCGRPRARPQGRH